MTCGPSQPLLPSRTRTPGPTIIWATVTRPPSTCGVWLCLAGAARLTTRSPSHHINHRPQSPPPPSPLTGATDRGVRCPPRRRLLGTIIKASKGTSTRVTIVMMHFQKSQAKTIVLLPETVQTHPTCSPGRNAVESSKRDVVTALTLACQNSGDLCPQRTKNRVRPNWKRPKSYNSQSII